MPNDITPEFKEAIRRKGREERKARFIAGIVDYCTTYNKWNELSKEEAVALALRVLTDDIHAAQAFIDSIGLTVDLYTYPFVN